VAGCCADVGADHTIKILAVCMTKTERVSILVGSTFIGKASRSSVRRHDLSTSSIKKKYTIGCILEEDLGAELRSPLNVFDGVVGAGN
jgi:hypothetical protein